MAEFQAFVDCPCRKYSTGDAMRHLLTFCLFLLLGGISAQAQVLPASSGSCNISASGLHVCNWLSGTYRNPSASNTTDLADDSRSTLFVTRFTLAPGAPLDSRSIVGGEVMIVGRNDGELINEKKSPAIHINVYDDLVMLMPKGESYLLRNVGKQNVELLVIEVRK
jgi:hypothetical protein